VSTTIHVNPVAPQALVMTCTPSDALPDMTQVLSSVLMLSDPFSKVIKLPAIITAQTTTSLTLTHAFQPGDVSLVGTYSVYPVHTVDAGTVRGAAQQFQSIGSFA
jgi:hypothetical protein